MTTEDATWLPPYVSLSKQILIIIISCQIQELLRLCQPTHQPTQRRAHHDIVKGLLPEVTRVNAVCSVMLGRTLPRVGKVAESEATTTKRWNAKLI